jgi:hypothetical protein
VGFLLTLIWTGKEKKKKKKKREEEEEEKCVMYPAYFPHLI